MLPLSAPRRRTVVALAPVTLLLPLLAGCGGGALGGGPEGEGPQVVTSVYPLQYVAERVVGDHATVENLTSQGAEPHDLELTPSQTADIAEADLVAYQEGFQPAVDEAVEQNGPDARLETTSAVAPEDTGRSGENDEGEDHEHTGEDPHFWLDPTKLGEVAAAFTDQMADIDPAHASDYRANLAALRADLRSLDADYSQGLADCAVDAVVVSHDAFGYLGRYGLRFEPIAGLSPDAEPSSGHLGELQDLVAEEKVTTVFSEVLASPKMAETLAGDLGLKTAVLDPIEGLSDATGDEDYLSLMRANLAALQEANQCR